MKIEIVMKNVTPFHSSKPGAYRCNLEGFFVDRGGFPCVRTATMPVIAAASGEERAPRPVHALVMPANSMRHSLRASALEFVLEHLRHADLKLSTAAFATMWVGTASGKPDGIAPSFAEVAAVRAHPFLGLFGGGPRMIAGKLSVDRAWGITADTLPLLGEYPEYAVSGNLTQVVFRRRTDPLLGIQPESMELLNDGLEAVPAYEELINAEAIENEEGEAESTRSLKAFMAHEVVIPGVNWLWRVDLDRPNDAQVGLVLRSLEAMNNGVLGGMGSQGYGRVRFQSVRVNGEEVLSGDFFDESADIVQETYAALAEALDTIKADDFEAFAASVRKQAPAKPAKKAKAEAAA